MAAGGVGGDGEVEVALLGDAHHGDGAFDAQGHVGRDGPALVEHEARVDAVVGKPGGRPLGRRAKELLLAGREEPDVARRTPAPCRQVLEGLEAAAEAEASDGLTISNAAQIPTEIKEGAVVSIGGTLNGSEMFYSGK